MRACVSFPFLFVLLVGCSSENETTSSSSGSSSGGSTNECTAAREQYLASVDAASTGTVTVLSDEDGVKTVFVDASAGGTQAAAQNPRIYLNLETVTKADVKDPASRTDTTWDIAIKRPLLYTNSGDGGGGKGGSAFLAGKEITAVTAADATSATFESEDFFDDACNPSLDQTNAIKSSFDGWYDYDTATNKLSPKAGTWLVKGATGKTYKIQITGYYANPDGSTGMAGGRYTMKVGAL